MAAGLQIKDDLQLVSTPGGWQVVVKALPVQPPPTLGRDTSLIDIPSNRRRNAELAADLLIEQRLLTDLHRQDFPALKLPSIPENRVPRVTNLRRILANQDHKEISPLNFGAKLRARRAARTQARQLHADLKAAAALDHEAKLALLEQQWERLQANQPDAVISVVNQAFADNAAPAIAVDVQDDELTALVYIPGVELPSYKAVYQMSSMRTRIYKTTERDRNLTYQLLVYGHAIVTAKEAFAVAQGISTVRVIAVRITQADDYGLRATEALLVGSFARELFDQVRWHIDSVDQVLDTAATELVVFEDDETEEMLPLDLTEYPNILALINSVQIDYQLPPMTSWPLAHGVDQATPQEPSAP